MLKFILKRETILTTLYTILLSLLISRFSIEYLYMNKSIYGFIVNNMPIIRDISMDSFILFCYLLFFLIAGY